MLQITIPRMPAEHAFCSTHSPIPASLVTDSHFFQYTSSNSPAIADSATIQFERKKTIYSQHDAARHCYKVVKGAVRNSRILTDGHRQILDIFLPADRFGIETGDTRSSTAEAIGDVVLLRCAHTSITRLNADQPETRQQMLAMLSRSLCRAQDHIVMLGHQRGEQRICSFLLRLAKSQGCPVGEAFDLPVGRQDLADYLGLTIETACRILSRLKSSRIISVPSRRQIIILALARLEAAASGNI
jgi:CRP/FNR family nitrogen fixation transcriptional regulator